MPDVKSIIRFVILLCLAWVPFFAQSLAQEPQESYKRGMEALSRSDYEDAIEKFNLAIDQNPTTIPAYYYLGLLLNRFDRNNEALAAYQRLLAVDPDNIAAHYQIGKIQLKLTNQEAANEEYRWLKEQAEGAANAPVDNDDRLLKDKPKDPARALSKRQREYAGELAEYLSDLILSEKLKTEATDKSPQTTKTSVGPDMVVAMSANMRPTILYKEKAKYTEIARLNKAQGTVALNVVFSNDGQITDVRVIRSLPDGLTQAAIRAARLIRFQPPIRDGVPLSVRGTLEFTFNLY